MTIILLATYGLYVFFMLKTHKHLFAAESEQEGHGDGGRRWSLARALATLLVASVLAAFTSEVLVGAAEGTGQALGMSSAFVGLVFLAIVGGAAESGSAIAMGRANRMDLAVSIVVGSSIQIALFVAPLLVLLSCAISPQPLQLLFPRPLVVTTFISVLVAAVVIGDGRYVRAPLLRGAVMLAVHRMPGGIFEAIVDRIPAGDQTQVDLLHPSAGDRGCWRPQRR